MDASQMPQVPILLMIPLIPALPAGCNDLEDECRQTQARENARVEAVMCVGRLIVCERDREDTARHGAAVKVESAASGLYNLYNNVGAAHNRASRSIGREKGMSDGGPRR